MKKRINKFYITALLFAWGGLTFAQTATEGEQPVASGSHLLGDNLTIALVAGAVILIFTSIIVLYQSLLAVLDAKRMEILASQGADVLKEMNLEERPNLIERLYKQMTNVVPVEKEQDILLDHDYDGIHELDNSLPPWWLWMFYISIIFGFFYIGYFHFSDNAKGQLDYYQEEMEIGEKQKMAYLRAQADLVNEENAEPLTDELSLGTGATIFKTNCASCHGQLGEGGIGPNLTDEFWIHGGDFKSVFSTVKYGVPEKGMIAWSTQITPSDIHKVASYIRTLKGTNPPNQKEPQGEKYEETDAPSETPAETPAEATDEVGMN